MKPFLLLLLLLLVGIAASCFFGCTPPARRVGTSTQTAALLPLPASSPLAAAVPEVQRDLRLEAYVLDAMRTWAPPATMIDRDTRHYAGIARDIVDVVQDERPAWADDHTKAKTAILLAAIAYWESHFWRHVDDGTCNDPIAAKKAFALIARTGNCDGGWAYSLWQVHPEGGIVLTKDGWKHSWDAPGEKAIVGADMIKDRRVAARVALRMARASIERSGTLCGYSGEPGPCPKAVVRLDFARSWSRRHPYPRGER